MIVKRTMKLSYDLPIEDILELIKQDILEIRKNRDFTTDRIYIESKVYT